MSEVGRLLVVLGSPGSGKGTQSELLAKVFGYERIVMGDLIRAFISDAGSPEARRAKERYDMGIPQPDELALKLLKEEITKLKNAKGIVLDNFPLSLDQARALDAIIAEFAIPAFKAVFLNVGKEEVVKRIVGRKICSGCKRIYLPGNHGYKDNRCDVCGEQLVVRADDDVEIAKQRYDEYERRNELIKKYYRETGALVEIDGERPIEAVHREIFEKLQAA